MTSAVSLVCLGRAMNLTILEKRSTTVRTVVFACEIGSPVTKSIDMSDHGLEIMGSGWRSPMHALEEVLFRAQTEQTSMYSMCMKAVRCEPNESPVDVAQRGQKKKKNVVGTTVR